jgi:hypothetical protein
MNGLTERWGDRKTCNEIVLNVKKMLSHYLEK